MHPIDEGEVGINLDIHPISDRVAPSYLTLLYVGICVSQLKVLIFAGKRRCCRQ
jgi:hypothetical protein